MIAALVRIPTVLYRRSGRAKLPKRRNSATFSVAGH
jgi:hypothetical protein